MQSLPAEVYGHIFELACSDGGHTGCSLSLVSRNIASASRPWRYRDLSLIGAKPILAFASLAVYHLQRNTYLDVRYLFIADSSQEKRHPDDWLIDEEWYRSSYNACFRDQHATTGSYWSQIREKLIPSSNVIVRCHIEGQVRAVNKALKDILSACAPTLRALYLNLITRPIFSGLVPVHLPVLEELTLLTVSPPELTLDDFVSAEALGPDMAAHQPLHTLRRLHVFDDRHPYVSKTSRQITEWVLGLAPGVTHLRLSWNGLPLDMYHRFDPQDLLIGPAQLEHFEIHSNMVWCDFASHHLFEHIFKHRIERVRAPQGERTGAYLAFNGSWNLNGKVYNQPKLAAKGWFCEDLEGANWVEDEDRIPLGSLLS